MNHENTGMKLNTLIDICNTYGLSPKIVASGEDKQIGWDFDISKKYEKKRNRDDFKTLLLSLMLYSKDREFITAIELFDHLINEHKLNPKTYSGYHQKKTGTERKWSFNFGNVIVEVMVEEKDDQDDEQLKAA